jgi:Undecaprenyl-phosphate glucose phosphotransferase
MDDAMSRIGPSLRTTVLRTASVPMFDAGPKPLPTVIAVLLAGALDALTCAAAPFLVAAVVPGAPGWPWLARMAVLTAVLTLSFGAVGGAYRHAVLFRTREQVRAVLRAGAGAVLVVGLATLLLTNDLPPSSLWVVAAPVALLGGLAAGRLALARLLSSGSGVRFAQRTVVVGSGLAGSRLLGLIRQLDERSLRIVGIVDDQGDFAETLVEGVPLLGPVAQVFALVRRGLVDDVVLALPWAEESRILDLIERLSDYPVHVRLAPDLISYHFPRRVRMDVDGHAVLHVAERPISGWKSVVKRTEDLLVSGAALVICALPMAFIALAIKLDSGGPVLFRQKRTGFNNHEFEMLKFRTMYHDKAEYRIREQTSRNDPRVTRVGAVLRRTSLDELPQIINVLRGDMSLVGPRPHAPGTRAGERPFEQVARRYAARHRVKPGLTGLAQVRGLRGETRTEDKLLLRVESDLEYIESWSPWLDFVILLRTLVIVLRMKNAY